MIKSYLYRFIIVVTCANACLLNPLDSKADIQEIRKSFHLALLDQTKVESFHNFMKEQSDDNPTVVAYKAMSEALMSQKAWNPIEKFVYIQNYQETMNGAIQSDAMNLEIRFLRFSVEYYIPTWLGFSKNIEKDTDFINRNSNKVNELMFDINYIRYISYFIKETNQFSPKELEKILNNMAR